MIIAFFGISSFKHHKRGVENVIDFQAQAYALRTYYYFHWGNATTCYKYKNYICFSIKNCWYWPILLNIIFYKIKKNSIVVHSHNTLFSIFSIWKTDVLTVHDGLYYHSKQQKNKLNNVLWFLEKILYFRCTKVHFISNFTKSQSLFGRRLNYTIIPNSSHLEKLVLNLQALPNNSANFILIVRSIEERARFDLLIQVAKILNDYNFIVAGKGPLLTYYIDMIKKENIHNIQMLGYVDDITLMSLYTNCEMVLNIAEYGEGFGLPIIEGYLFNKPVIASNKCAIPEVIISKDYLFNNTVESIQKKIIQLKNIKSPDDYRAFYFARYSNEITASKLRKLVNI